MKKIINFRILFFCFVTFALAIFFANELLSGSIFHIIFFVGSILIFALISIKRKAVKKFACVCLAFILGICTFLIGYNNFEGKIFVGEQTISGRVSNVQSYVGYQRVVLTNVKINGDNEKNITATISGTELDLGTQIEFIGEIETITQFSLGEYSSFAYKNGAPYFCKIDNDDITLSTTTKLTIGESFRQSVKNLLLKNMPKESANLAYSMLFGDKSSLDKEISESFRVSGIAHALAVSGLHVGFLIGVVNFILNRLKAKPWVRLLVASVVLLFYCYLCNFSPSVVRATVMSIVMLSAAALGRQYDILNSLSLSGIVILLIRPMSVFDAGFQLSFMSVLCIALLAKPTQALFAKLKLPKFVSSPLALTICVQIGILPFIAKYYTSVSLLSVVTNFICIPLFQVAFVMLVILIICTLIIPALGIFLTPVHWLLSIIIKITKLIANVSSSVINLVALDFAGIISFYIGMFIVSGFVMMQKTYKTIVCSALFIFSLIYGILLGLPKKYDNLNIMQVDNNNSQYSLIISNNQSILIGDFKDIEQLVKFLKRGRIKTVDYVIMPTESENELLNNFYDDYDVDKVIHFGEDYSGKNLNVKYVITRTKPVAIEIEIDGYKIMYVNDKLEQIDEEILNYYIDNVNILLNSQYALSITNVDYRVSQSSLVMPQEETQDLNNWIFNLKNGDLKRIWSLN